MIDRRQAIINLWANDVSIQPHVAPGFPLMDYGTFFDNPRNVMTEHKHGIALFIYIGNGDFDGHFLFGPNLRGKDAVSAAQAMINDIFTVHHANSILGKTPVENRPARLVSRALGFIPYGRGSVDTFNRPCVDYVLSRNEWMHQSWASLKEQDDG